MKNNSGFTLVETLMSLIIFAIILMGLNYAYIVAMTNSVRNDFRDMGVDVTKEFVTDMRNDNISNIGTTAITVCDPDNSSIIYTREYRGNTINYGVVRVSDNGTLLRTVVFSVCWKIKDRIYSIDNVTEYIKGTGGL